MSELRYSMKVVSQRTGLSPHVLRVWERRYGAVEPARSESNRRLYAEEEVARLEHLARLTHAGHGIRQIATLPLKDLQAMTSELPKEETPGIRPATGQAELGLLEEAWQSVLKLDGIALRTVLDRATVSLGISAMVEKLIVPLIERIGTGWEHGQLSAAEEHAASAVIKEVLFLVSRPFAESAGAPGMVMATPAGQLHELGAVLATCIARQHGWEVTYLGPSLPAEEIARAAIRNEALAVGLSVVYPGDDPQLPDELRRLRKALPAEVAILVGGRAAANCEAAIREIGATRIHDLVAFRTALENLRSLRVK